MPLTLFKKFLQLESAGGIILFAMMIVAMIWANSPLAFIHQQFIDKFLFLINEGLMAIFFLFVGLELKHGLIKKRQSSFSQVFLAAIASLGGMFIPALIYCLINYGNPLTLKGWATPVATDIAFALGALSLFGRAVPSSLKLFLLILAIFDDVGAILIIALFYTREISFLYLGISALIFVILCLFNFFSVRRLEFYLLGGILLWSSLLGSGVHPTIAGVLLAITIPTDVRGVSPSQRLELSLHPWVVYLIMPLFALANAGFSLKELSWTTMTDNVVLGIVLGLFLGKQMGVFGFSWALIQFTPIKLPKKTTWLALYGVSLLCGIGFTMSLFLGTLSFQNENFYLTKVRLGVLMGSLLSVITGLIVLFIVFARKRRGLALD